MNEHKFGMAIDKEWWKYWGRACPIACLSTTYPT